MRRRTLALGLLFAGLLLAAGASAAPVSPVGLAIFIGGDSDPDSVPDGTFDQNALGCVPGAGETFVCSGSSLVIGGTDGLTLNSWDLTFDVDPVVSGITAVTNNSLVSQQFTLVFTLPTGPIGPSTLTGGSIQGGVTDNNGDGATLSTAGAGTAFYQGLIDGASDPARTLYPEFTSYSAGSFLSNNVPNIAFGTPIPSLASPAVVNNIGIRLDFILTPGDSASFTSNFVVVVPEPSTALTVGLGLIGLVIAGRRRSE